MISIPVGRGVDSQVNKFEQMSCHDHQMSVAGGRSPGFRCRGWGGGLGYHDDMIPWYM